MSSSPVVSFARRISRLLRGDLGELIRGASSYAIVQFFAMLVGVVYYIVLARMYGKSAIGAFALSMTIAHMFQLVGTLGCQRSATRFVAAVPKDQPTARRRVFSRMVVLVLPALAIAGVLLYLASSWLSQGVFRKEELAFTLPVLAFALPLLGLHAVTHGALLGIKRVAEASAFSSLIPATVATVALVCGALLWMPAKIFMVPIYAHLLGLSVAVVIGLAIWCRWVPSGGEVRDVPSYGELLRVSSPMMITAGMHLLLNWTDTLMLGYFRETAEIGEYRIAFRIAVLNGFALTAVNSISRPKFAETHAAEDIARLRRIARDATRIVMLVSLPVFLVTVIAPEFVLGFFGPEFKAVAPVLVILCIGKFFSACCGPVGSFLNMTGQQVPMGRIMVVSAVMNAVLNFLLIPRFGLIGAAVATTISVVAWNVAATLRVYRTHGFFFWFSFRSSPERDA
jgi:O-antigen/teichoic acid export membrane protein